MIHKFTPSRETLKLHLICLIQNSPNLKRTKMSSKLSDFPEQRKNWAFATFAKARLPSRIK